LALAGEGHAFFEKFHGVVQRKLGTFQAANHFFEAGKGTLKVRFFRWFGLLGNR
jgi:hypothetical protein